MKINAIIDNEKNEINETNEIVENNNQILSYIPPTPWEGTGNHRILFLCCEQKDKIEIKRVNEFIEDDNKDIM